MARRASPAVSGSGIVATHVQDDLPDEMKM
jgi:hypothetical protein